MVPFSDTRGSAPDVQPPPRTRPASESPAPCGLGYGVWGMGTSCIVKSFRSRGSLSGRRQFTVRRHKFNTDSLSFLAASLDKAVLTDLRGREYTVAMLVSLRDKRTCSSPTHLPPPSPDTNRRLQRHHARFPRPFRGCACFDRPFRGYACFARRYRVSRFARPFRGRASFAR